MRANVATTTKGMVVMRKPQKTHCAPLVLKTDSTNFGPAAKPTEAKKIHIPNSRIINAAEVEV